MGRQFFLFFAVWALSIQFLLLLPLDMFCLYFYLAKVSPLSFKMSLLSSLLYYIPSRYNLASSRSEHHFNDCWTSFHMFLSFLFFLSLLKYIIIIIILEVDGETGSHYVGSPHWHGSIIIKCLPSLFTIYFWGVITPWTWNCIYVWETNTSQIFLQALRRPWVGTDLTLRIIFHGTKGTIQDF